MRFRERARHHDMITNPHVQSDPTRPSTTASASGSRCFDVSPLAGPFGAEVTGIDLAQPWTREVADAFRRTFIAHALLVVRGQSMTKARMGEFAALFGEVEGNVFRKPDGSTMEPIHDISNLDAAGQPAENPYLKSNYHWHTDKAYLPVPALLTMLQAVELPPSGGDTEFADMSAAYGALPDSAKARIDGLRVVHSFEFMRTSTGDRPLTPEERAATPPVVHPLVRTHPDTGRRSLYLGMYCSHVVGMDAAQGRALLDDLLAHATQARFVYTHRWARGDLVLWDNRCLLHRAIPNYDMGKSRRVLNRLVVKGTSPP